MGRRLGGRYRLDEPVGNGGMAVVWRAWDLVLGRAVAVKLLLAHRASDRRIREQVKDEARAAAQLTHPNVATVHDFGEFWSGAGRLPYVVMEFVDGQTLADRLRADGPLHWRTAASICAHVADALAAAHGRGLVHRDVKPGNVMLTASGSVKVVDFGLAAATGHDQADSDGRVFGTPGYAAPEQYHGYPVAPASDMYAFGLLLRECLTGQPFHGTGAQAADAPPPAMPADLAELCRRCLSEEPSRRPTSTEAAQLLAGADALTAVIRPAAADTARMADADERTRSEPLATATGSRRVEVPTPNRRRLNRRRAAVLGGVPAGLLGAVVAAQLLPLSSWNAAGGTPGAEAAAPPVRCAARYSAWERPDSTFTADLTVTNAGGQPLDGWVVTFLLPPGHQLSDVDGAGWEVTGRKVRLTGSGALAVGHAAAISLSGAAPRGADAPASFMLDGIACDRAVARISAAHPAPGPTSTGSEGVNAGGAGDGGPAASTRPAQVATTPGTNTSPTSPSTEPTPDPTRTPSTRPTTPSTTPPTSPPTTKPSPTPTKPRPTPTKPATTRPPTAEPPTSKPGSDASASPTAGGTESASASNPAGA